MKIDDVELTLFSWDDILTDPVYAWLAECYGPQQSWLPAHRNGRRHRRPRPPGSAINPAETDAGALIRFVKPVLMGKDPLAREDLHAAMTARQRSTGLRVIGACDTALWDIGAKAAGAAPRSFSERKSFAFFNPRELCGREGNHAVEPRAPRGARCFLYSPATGTCARVTIRPRFVFIIH